MTKARDKRNRTHAERRQAPRPSSVSTVPRPVSLSDLAMAEVSLSDLLPPVEIWQIWPQEKGELLRAPAREGTPANNRAPGRSAKGSGRPTAKPKR